MAENAIVESIKNSAELLNTVLATGAGLAGIVVLLKLAGKSEFEVWKVPVKLSYAWTIFSLFTIGHIYVASLLIGDAYHIFYDHHELAVDAWKSLTGAKLLFFHGLVARINFTTMRTSSGREFRLYEMSPFDQTTWLVYGVAVLVFIAIIRWHKVSWKTRAGTTLAAFVIVILNWLIGSNWVIAVSELTVASSQSVYFSALRKVLEHIH